MGYIIIILFILAGLLSFFEKYLGKYKLPIYIVLGLCLILLAGFREVGIDPDSENYEYEYQNYYSEESIAAVDFSYIFFASLFNNISSDVHIIFLFYAFWGVFLKFKAIRNLSGLWFLPVLVYLSFYYELHEMTQIRTGVTSGFFLLAIKPMAEGQRWKALLWLALAVFFHISAMVLIPLLFLSNHEMSVRRRWTWLSIIPIGYFIYMAGYTMSVLVDIPYIGEKLAFYQTAEEYGFANVSVNVFSPLFLFTVLLYIYLMYFHDTIVRNNTYFPLMMKIYGVGIFAFLCFAFLPVLSQRLSFLYRIVTIILFSNIYYTIRPKWVGMLAVILVAFIYLNYALPYIGFEILWHSNT